MDANEREYINELVRVAVGCAYEVSNQLGNGFLEKIYERAMILELGEKGISGKSQVPFPVRYKGHTVGNYIADLLVDNRLLLELKCVDSLTDQHIAQCINYMKASGIKVCLLMNFNKTKVEWKRLVFGF